MFGEFFVRNMLETLCEEKFKKIIRCFLLHFSKHNIINFWESSTKGSNDFDNFLYAAVIQDKKGSYKISFCSEIYKEGFSGDLCDFFKIYTNVSYCYCKVIQLGSNQNIRKGPYFILRWGNFKILFIFVYRMVFIKSGILRDASLLCILRMVINFSILCWIWL